jgi:hypothetical protein
MRLPVLIMVLVAAAPWPAVAHDWYEGLRSPHGADCCGGRDCRPVPYHLNPETGQEEIKANGAWWPIDYGKVLPFPSPDSSAHACWISPVGIPAFICIILPGMAGLDRSPASPDSPAQAARSPLQMRVGTRGNRSLRHPP